MSIHKIVTLLVWVAGIVALVYPSNSTAATVLSVVVLFLLVAHLIEIAVFWKVLKNAPGSLAGHIVNTFLFGVFHVRPLKKAQESAILR